MITTRTPYLSIDIETTGLDPEYCQIIEFGAVLDDWVTPVKQLQRFHSYVRHDRIVGEPFALQMNAAILKKLADGEGIRAENLWVNFLGWLRLVSSRHGKWLVTGKNFGSFDLQFINRLPNFVNVFHHRNVDPGSMYWQPDEDEVPPGMAECLKRAGINSTVQHTAVEDAMDVIRLVRAAHSEPF